MDDVLIRYSNMPARIRGMTVLDENGDYNVYINPIYSTETQKKILEHELNHINQNHFYSDINIKDKEK